MGANLDQPLNVYLDLSEASTLSADVSTADLMTTLQSMPPDQWTDLEVRLALSSLLSQVEELRLTVETLCRSRSGGLARE